MVFRDVFSRRGLIFLVSLIVLGGLCLFDDWLFRKLANARYFRWYLDYGPLVGLATAAFGVAWGNLDRQVGLVSARPDFYLSACLQVVGLPMIALGGHLRTAHRGQMNSLDRLVAVPMVFAIVLAALAWLIFVAPIQYFLFLLTAAPSRVALRSDYRVHARLQDGKVTFTEVNQQEPVRLGSWDASMRSWPLTIASALSAALLFILARIVVS